MTARKTALDVLGQPIQLNGIVTIVGHTAFTDYQGLVMDTESRYEPEDGPVAVYFGKEVPDSRFTNRRDFGRLKGGIPTPEDYRDHPRIVCFEPREVKVEDGWSSMTLARRAFPNGFWFLSSPQKPLISNLHLCHLKDCESGLRATDRAFINASGTVVEVYVCGPCHKRAHGMCCDTVSLKHPLPWDDQVRRSA